ncbi:MAG: DUF4392 domain-containing protein [Candidatus Vecturithrix sp.]|jgi:hypothetical protein|nr:DUF4392 domain-containing protein [Candidatus Vecturithrix sp.]
MMLEDILLRYSDQRHIHQLQKYLPRNFCEQAADAILAHPGRVLITTGFWVAGTCETDGPIGAIVLADVLSDMGSDPVFVTDRYCVEILRGCRQYRVIDFPIASHQESQAIAQSLLAEERPVLLISIERCGMSQDGHYYNMRRVDVSEHTAKIDHLFLEFPHSIGIGDGGNEIGMGNLAKEIAAEALPITPCVTRVQHPLIATVSNWAAYGIVAYLSQKQQCDYMRYVAVRTILAQLVAQGVVDGVLKEPVMSVDGFEIETIETIVAALRKAAGL